MFSKMTYLDRDTFNMRTMSVTRHLMTKEDSTLFSHGIPKRTVVEPYYISATEVTNEEWRTFYNDKILELGKREAKKEFYSDTTLWITEYPYSYNKPMARNYFSHPSFNDFPIVGITWTQAKAYCLWKSKKVETLLEKKGIKSNVEFRLPTEAEWENAVLKKQFEEKYPKRTSYSWNEENLITRINELNAQIGSRQGISKNKASTKIGFRITISNVSSAVLKYFPKKNWTP